MARARAPRDAAVEMLDDAEGRSEEQDTVEELREVGADLALPRPLEHLFVFPFASQAHEAANELREDGFQVAVEQEPEEEGEGWLAIARHEIPVSVEALTRLRSRFERFALLRGGEYDGWNVPLFPWEERGVDPDDDVDL